MYIYAVLAIILILYALTVLSKIIHNKVFNCGGRDYGTSADNCEWSEEEKSLTGHIAVHITAKLFCTSSNAWVWFN